MENKQIVRLTLSALLLFCAVPMAATELGDSIDTYQNQTVSTEVFVQGRNVLTSSNVTVTPTGHLTMSAPNGIVINSNFSVQLGGRLQLNGGRQWPIVYDYDSSGNTTARRKN